MLNIITYPTESLNKRSIELDQNIIISKKIKELIDEMIPTMYQDDGIGLAAPQVGHNIRLCIIGKEALKFDNKTELDTTQDIILINPIWEKTSRKKEWDKEGCLSVPKTYGKVKRYRDIHVDALDRNGNPLSFEAHGFFARVIQHEVDHLDGILFIKKAKDIYETE